jgi:folate-binding protein YgfZ
MTERGDSTYEAIRSAAACRVVSRDGVLASGPGAFDWLQGQVSQDLSGLAGSEVVGNPSIETLVLSPQGKIESSCRVTALGHDGYLLDLRSGFGEALFDRLRRFKLRIKAELELLDGLLAVEVRGPRVLAASALASPIGAGLMAVAPVDWPGLTGIDVLFRGEQPSLVDLGFDVVVSEETASKEDRDGAFEAVRIEAGMPELGSELTDRTIPQEAGELVARTVSFTKGCYTGQELVARIDARGSNTPRRLHGVVIESGAPAAGNAVLVDGTKVGELTSVAWSPGFDAYVALAYIKRGTDTPTAAVVDTADSDDAKLSPASIRLLPLVTG